MNSNNITRHRREDLRMLCLKVHAKPWSDTVLFWSGLTLVVKLYCNSRTNISLLQKKWNRYAKRQEKMGS